MHKILIGDALTQLRTIRDNSINCVVTSPPYWGLRDYGHAEQIGLEKSFAEFVEKLTEVFREVHRVLRDDGTLWLNLGDSYAGSGRGGNPDAGTKQGTNKGSQTIGVLYGREHESAEAERARLKTQAATLAGAGIKAKDLVGIPWRVAFALQTDGWWLRQDIIWSKPNPMPESVTDRCTKSHEYLFLLSKSPRYYFDAEAIKEPMVAGAKGSTFDGPRDLAVRPDTGRGPRAKGNAKTFRGGGNYTKQQSFENSSNVERESHGNVPNESGLRNRRSVWNITPQPFKEAHFATFPVKLVEPCILAGCPENGVVLDPFAGSGTTGVAAKRLKRHAILIELNPAYAEMAERRITATAEPSPPAKR